MTMYDPENPQHLAYLEQHRAVIREKARRQCPHGEPLGTCHDCLEEHREATR
jgi:hypothetical protein